MFHIFYFLQCHNYVLGIVNPLSWKFIVISSEKSCLMSSWIVKLPFLLTYLTYNWLNSCEVSGVFERNIFLSIVRLFTRELDNRSRHEEHIVVKENKNTRRCPNDPISHWTEFGEGRIWALLVVTKLVLPNRYSWITLKESFVNPPPTIHYRHRCGKMDSATWKPLVYNFTKGFLRQTISRTTSRGFRRVDYWCWGEGGEDKELLDLFTKHSQHQNITVLYLCQDMFR